MPLNDSTTRLRFSPIVELRRYTLYPGRREALIELFDTHFVESQEACGMKIIGQFRDLDDPDAFVWLRGFASMQERHEALTAFYGGPVWGEHRNAANATMIDSDDVLLLHPAADSGGFLLPNERRTYAASSDNVLMSVTYRLKQPAEAGFLSTYLSAVQPLLRAEDDALVAHLASEHSENTYTQLPIRLGENVYVTFSRFEDVTAGRAFNRSLERHFAWHAAQQAVSAYLLAPPSVAWLTPTAKSLLR